jgi:hypothetical protein
MALPAHLAHFDTLLDLLADAVVREMAATIRPPETPTPDRPNDSPEPSCAARKRGAGNALAQALQTYAKRAA